MNAGYCFGGIMKPMKRIVRGMAVLFLLFSGCGKAEVQNPAETTEPDVSETTAESEDEQMGELYLKIGEENLDVKWENNESVDFLKEQVRENPRSVELSMYGGFEQVGSLGFNVPRNDVQTVTDAGDIVLYSGNQIVLFYGSNSWSYTRLGHIENKTPSQLKDLLGNGDVTITLYWE